MQYASIYGLQGTEVVQSVAAKLVYQQKYHGEHYLQRRLLLHVK